LSACELVTIVERRYAREIHEFDRRRDQHKRG